MALRELLSNLNEAVNRMERNKGWLGSLVEQGGDDAANVHEEVVEAKTSEDPTESSESQDNSTALIQNATKASEQGKKASLIWKSKWTYSRNVSQLLSNGMRMCADDMGLVFKDTGYVDADIFAEKVNTMVLQNQIPRVSSKALQLVILGFELEQKEQTFKVTKDGKEAGDINKKFEGTVELNEQSITTDNLPMEGMGDRHQYITDEGKVWVRCMNGHLSKYYGNEPGQIQLEIFFTVLGEEVQEAYHDTDVENTSGIDKLGLVAPEDGRFIHLWWHTGRKKGRSNKEVTYTVDVKTARKEGVKFWLAANGVVLVEKRIARKYLTECKRKMGEGSDDNGYRMFLEMKGISSKEDNLVLKFASELYAHAIKGPRNNMSILKDVLKATIKSHYFRESQLIREKYKQLRSNLQLDSVDPASDYQSREVASIELSLLFYYNQELKTYLIMMKGRRDAEMIALAKEYGFPRGCPVLWKPGDFIDFRGFSPKFENDERETEEDEGDRTGDDPSQTKSPFDDSVLDNASSLFFFRKWSGFLLQITAFKIETKVYWTVCSKNYADPKSVFIQRGVSVFGQLLGENKGSTLLQTLADDHLYLGGELLHVDDEHGYIAKENALIVTCVGMGSFANLEGVKEKYSKLVDYYTPSAVVDFCSEHQLMSDTSYTITGTKADLTRFVNSLLRDRDLMRNSDFERIMSENSPEKTAGTADHMKLVGDVLEGFVFHIQKHGDDGNTTVKVKLPFYTWRTFFLRVRLERIVGKDYDRIEGYDFVNKDTLSRIKRFTRRWCFTHAEEFTRLMKCAMVRLQTGWPAVLADLQACTSENLKVKGRAHVIVADYVENLYFSESGKELIDRDCQEFDAILTGYNSLRQSAVSICICVGPVGSGKSTFCQRIADRNPAMYELIDGDSG